MYSDNVLLEIENSKELNVCEVYVDTINVLVEPYTFVSYINKSFNREWCCGGFQETNKPIQYWFRNTQ